MTKRIRHTGKLMHQSFSVIRQHKKLFLFPLLSTLIVILVLTAIVTPLTQREQAVELMNKGHLHRVFWFYVILLIFIFIMHQIIFYFNSAMTYCILQYFNEKNPSLKEGFKNANNSFFHFFLWNLFAATTGIFFNLFQRHLRQYRFYKNLFRGLRWSIATYMAIPVILIKNTTPLNTIKCSRDLIQQTWGTQLRANFGFIGIIVLTRIVAIIPLIIALALGGKTNIIIAAFIAVGINLIAGMINSSTRTILCSALYFFAAEKRVAPGFSEKLLKQAFRVIHNPMG